jgi:hypothetical protein
MVWRGSLRCARVIKHYKRVLLCGGAVSLRRRYAASGGAGAPAAPRHAVAARLWALRSGQILELEAPDPLLELGCERGLRYHVPP